MWSLLLLACAPPGSTPADKAAADDSGVPSDDTGGTADCSADVPLEAHMVRTSGGVLRGIAAGEGSAWLGVPYAEPPTGDRRFRPPLARACVDGEVIEADAFGPACPQRDAAGAGVGDEDCLVLDVWAPPTGATAPVLVFLHGGGNVVGSIADTSDGVSLYDGEDLAAATGAVVVTVQYRLGALGFLAHPALTAEAGTGSGNYGLRDQLLALDWVHTNAPAFGGDPGRVLLFGESAGGLDTCVLLTSPLAEGRFHAALVESASCVVRTLETAETEGGAAAEAVGCADGDVPACLRALPADTLAGLATDVITDLGVPGGGGFGPDVDGEVLPGDPNARIEAGEALDVPVVLGTNHDETALWVPTLTEAEYTALVTATFGRWADTILDAYPLDAYPSPRAAWIALTTAATFTCPARRLARRLATANASPVFRYWFTKVPTGASGALYGSWHGLELAYVYQHLEEVADATGYRPDDADLAVEAAMGAAWGALAADGDPNGADLPVAWPVYDPATDPYLELGAEIRAGEGVATEACDVWDPILDLLGN